MLSLRAVLPRYRPSLEQVMIIPHYRGLFLCAINSLRFMAVYNKLEKMEGECMEKRLEDRSLEELWQLFPIFLVPYKKNGQIGTRKKKIVWMFCWMQGG